MSSIWYIIPAREGSKGMPHKNRKLFQYTVNTIPKSDRKNVIVSTDDNCIIEQSRNFNITCINRKQVLSSDKASTRDVLLDVIEEAKIAYDDIIVLLYLTYPSRSWAEVQKAVMLLKMSGEKSLLCKKSIDVSPYLMMFDTLDDKGRKVIDHDLCRRQDYNPCFLMSHFVGVFYANEIKNLDTNLWNRATIFMPISEKIDVDHQSDFRRYLAEKKDEC